MLTIKQPHVYRPPSSVRWFFGAILLAGALLPVVGILDGLRALHSPSAGFASTAVVGGLQLAVAKLAVYCVAYAFAFVVFLRTFWNKSLTIGPSGIVLRGGGRVVRIGTADILGRRRVMDENDRPVDVIVSRGVAPVSIQIPTDVPFDEFFRHWLHSLPDLDRAGPGGAGAAPTQGVSPAKRARAPNERST